MQERLQELYNEAREQGLVVVAEILGAALAWFNHHGGDGGAHTDSGGTPVPPPPPPGDGG